LFSHNIYWFNNLLSVTKTAAKLFIFIENTKENMQKVHICGKKAANMHFDCNKYAI